MRQNEAYVMADRRPSRLRPAFATQQPAQPQQVLQKPVRCGNPTLGRFDSGAAPLSRFSRVHADSGSLERPAG
jgi:hypothetical protein